MANIVTPFQLTENFNMTQFNNRINEINNNVNSSNTSVSDTVRNLYGLSVGDATVDKALQKNMQGGILNAILTGWNKTSDTGDVIPTDTLTKALNKIINNTQIIQGTYTGDGTTNRTINLGVTPKFVVILAVENESSRGQGYFKTNNVGLAIGTRGMQSFTQYKCVTNGFIVSTNDTGYDNNSNQSNLVYSYVAFL